MGSAGVGLSMAAQNPAEDYFAIPERKYYQFGAACLMLPHGVLATT